MSPYVFSLVAGAVFLLVALAHLLRIVFRVPIVVEDIPIPLWASGVAAVCAGFLSYEGFRFARKSLPRS
jgi:hypothetical protein